MPDAVIDLTLNSPVLDDFGPAVGEFLSGEGVQAARVRPDRYLFGSRGAQGLADAWKQTLGYERRLR